MRPALFAATWVLSGLAMAPALPAAEPGGDSWGVRRSAGVLESFSDVNTAKPPAAAPPAPSPIATRTRGRHAFELHGDAASVQRIAAGGTGYRIEIDQALGWMERLAPTARRRTRIVLTLVDGSRRVRTRRVHPHADELVVDLVVPLAPALLPSVAVGKAAATALHELSHALVQEWPGPAPSRRDDEYQASLVEACYLVDTLRSGDTLRLAPRAGADAGEYFVTAQSRNAARDVVADLVRASGTASVRWDDATALLGLRLACAIRVAARPATPAPPATPRRG